MSKPESQPAVPAQVEKPWWDYWRPESDYPDAAVPAADPLCVQPDYAKGWNDAIEAAAKHCDMFVEAYSFFRPYPDGYVYSDAESKAAGIFARERFECAAKTIRGLEPPK